MKPDPREASGDFLPVNDAPQADQIDYSRLTCGAPRLTASIFEIAAARANKRTRLKVREISGRGNS